MEEARCELETGATPRPQETLTKACSAFTRVTACTLALSPIRDTLSEGAAIAARE